MIKLEKLENGNVIIIINGEVEHMISMAVILQKHRRDEDKIMISLTPTNQEELGAIKLRVSEIESTIINGEETPFNGTRNDLLWLLSTDFFNKATWDKNSNPTGDDLDTSKEAYKFVAGVQTYNVSQDDPTLLVHAQGADGGMNVDVVLPASSDLPDDNKLHKYRIVNTGDGTVFIKIAGGEKFDRGMDYITLIGNVNTDITIGGMNKQGLFNGWQQEGEIKIITDVAKNTVTPSNLTNNAQFLIPFNVRNLENNKSVSELDANDPTVILAKTSGQFKGKYKLSIDSTGGGTYNVTAIIRVFRKQLDGSFVIEDLESSRSTTGNYGGEDSSINGYDFFQLGAGDKVALMVSSTNLTGRLIYSGFSLVVNL